MENKIIKREFALTTAALKNRNTVYLLMAGLFIAGVLSYINMPKEMFPEITLPKVIVKTVYPGNSPSDVENLVTRPLEKEIYTIKGLKKMSSTSSQDNSDMLVEFNSDIDVKKAVQDIKDAVDKAKNELPDDLPFDPMVIEMDVSEFPIINVNLSGDYSIEELKVYAEYLEDEIEAIPEISKANIKGVEDKLIRLNLDKDKMDAFNLSFKDIENAIKFENVSVSGGDLLIGKTRRSVKTSGEFKNIQEIENIIVKSKNGNIIYMRDVLENGKVINGFKDAMSLARLNNDPVVSLQIIKKSGQNLLSGTDKIMAVLAKAKADHILPKNLEINITNDQSDKVRKMIANLENSIIMGVLFVMWVLFFFLGTRNAVLVGMAIPMSMFISYLILSLMGYTINMMVLFGSILALGMLVDNGIVAVENIYRFTSQGHTLFDAIKYAVGEIAWPIIASTATTLAAFIPLIFWPGMIGNFMKYLPITLIVILSSSLFVALVIIPVLMLAFGGKTESRPKAKKVYIIVGITCTLALLFYITRQFTLANLLVIIAIVTLLNYLIFYNISVWFQNVLLVKMEDWYLKLLKFAMAGLKPTVILIGTFALMIVTIIFYFSSKPTVDLFPVNQPKYLMVKTELPVGADITATDSILQIVEAKINKIIDDKNYRSIVESVLTTMGKGAVGENETPIGNTPTKAVTTINFVDYEFREGKNTQKLQQTITSELLGKIPGIIFSVSKNKMGPPTGKAINIELSGNDFTRLLTLSDSIIHTVNQENIEGIEGLMIDTDLGKPELSVHIKREQARRFGLSTGQIASTIRTSLFGKEVTDFKVGEDKYPIQIQLAKKYRNNISTLMNQIITFRNTSGKFVHIPISAVADFQYETSFSQIKRINNTRVITIASNVVEGYNPTEINNKIKAILKNYKMPDGYKIDMTGQQKEQAEASAFLMKAMAIAVSLILIIMVTQFNSIVKPFIILASVLFSTIGVFGGLGTFKMDFVVIMTGIGIISLAGVVVNNAIVLIDYIDYLKSQRKEELGLEPDENLPLDQIINSIVNSGKTRLRPVLLTAITTVLGLLPMAVGMNIDFGAMLSEFKPNIYFGGDNADFWGPMAWTVIFGLIFATFLTLVVVPVMYLSANRVKLFFSRKK